MKRSHLAFLIGMLFLTSCGVADDPADDPSIPAPSTEETTTTSVPNSGDVTDDTAEESDTNQADEEPSLDGSESTLPPTTEYVPPTTKDGLPDHPAPSIPPPRG